MVDRGGVPALGCHLAHAAALRQQILVLRELGLGLDAVAEVLARSGPQDAVEVLRAHHARLVGERDRLDRLARTVAGTITDLDSGGEMAAEKIFEGFRHNPYEAEARERWGDELVEESARRIAGMTQEQAEGVSAAFTRVHEGLAVLRHDGVSIEDERVQALVAEHYRIVALFWTPDAAAYRGLGQMYVDDERFRMSIGQGDDALVAYLRDAMTVYAGTHLS